MNYKCSYTKLLDVSKVIPNPKNPNIHTEDQILRLSKIIDFQGQRSPIVISNQSGFIVVGHGRFAAMKLLGWEKVAVDYQDFENEAQEYAHMTADNAIAEWAALDLSQINTDILQLDNDFDMDLLGLKDFEIEVEKLDPQGDENHAPEIQPDPITKRGDIWLLGNHRILCGDSTLIDDVEKLMNGEKADMVFTDPPYGDNHAAMEMNRENMKSGKGDIIGKRVKIRGDKNLDIMPEVAANLSMVVKDKCPKIVFFKWKKWEETKSHWSVFGEPSSCCVWDRDAMSAAVFIFNPCHEFAFFWGSLAEKKNKSNLSNVWRCKKEVENKTLHPTVKPIEICENAIDAACEPKGLVVDAFLGSGSTLIACEKTNRKCYGMELDEKYCDVIVKRYIEYTGKEAVLESTGEKYSNLVNIKGA